MKLDIVSSTLKKVVPLALLAVGAALFAAGFWLGGQFMYVGKTSLAVNGTIKGGTVYLSGQCLVFNKKDRVSLLNYEAKVIDITEARILAALSIKDGTMTVDCPASTVTYDMLPFPVMSPNSYMVSRTKLTIEEAIIEKVSNVPDIAQKTIVASAICANVQTMETLPPFTDKLVDVLSLEPSRNRKDDYDVYAIRKEDSLSIVCPLKALKYRVASADDLNPKVEQPAAAGTGPVAKVLKTLRGQTIRVTSDCQIDPRQTQGKSLFFGLVNGLVEVLEDRISETGEVLYLKGAAVEAGTIVICDATKTPINWKENRTDGVEYRQIEPMKPAHLNQYEDVKDGSVLNYKKTQNQNNSGQQTGNKNEASRGR